MALFFIVPSGFCYRTLQEKSFTLLSREEQLFILFL